MRENLLDPQELLYRQLSPRLAQDYAMGPAEPPIPPRFFKPSDRDVTGLSVLRASQRHHRWAAYRETDADVRFELIRFFVGDLQSIGCSVVVEPDEIDEREGTNAHCVIPEFAIGVLGKEGKKTDQVAWKKSREAREALCGGASLGLIGSAAIGPFELPDASVPVQADAVFVERQVRELLAGRESGE